MESARRAVAERAGTPSVPSSVVTVNAREFARKLDSMSAEDVGCSDEDFIALLSAAEEAARNADEVSKFDLYRAASGLGHGAAAAVDAAWKDIVGEGRERADEGGFYEDEKDAEFMDGLRASPEFEAARAATAKLAAKASELTAGWSEDDFDAFGTVVINMLREDPEDAYMDEDALLYYAYFNSP